MEDTAASAGTQPSRDGPPEPVNPSPTSLLQKDSASLKSPLKYQTSSDTGLNTLYLFHLLPPQDWGFRAGFPLPLINQSGRFPWANVWREHLWRCARQMPCYLHQFLHCPDSTSSSTEHSRPFFPRRIPDTVSTPYPLLTSLHSMAVHQSGRNYKGVDFFNVKEYLFFLL